MAPIRYEQAEPGDRTFVCRGRGGCGVPVIDRAQHSRFHALVLGMAEELEQSGANDPGPMPSREDQ